MQRFFRNFKEIKTTVVGLILLGAAIYVAQSDMETALRTTLALSLAGGGLTCLGIKDPKKGGGGRAGA